MFFVLPYAHESQKVQRLPWITFILIGLNVALFIWTAFQWQDYDKLESAFLDLQAYYHEHPYLHPPDGTAEFLNFSMGSSADTFSGPEPPILQVEQKKLNALAREFLTLLKADPIYRYGYIPSEPHVWSYITSMFFHAGLFHLLGNMLFLYLAGCSIEDIWGRPLYLGFYLMSGLAALFAHAIRFPDSTVPLVGASGAIAGLMGAFLVRLHNTRILFVYLILTIRGTFSVPAWIVLPFWLLQQLGSAQMEADSDTAFSAHIGGFLFGILFALVLRVFHLEDKFIAPAIRQRVSLSQHPLFLQAMGLSDREQYGPAVKLLQKVLVDEPEHMESHMELRRIARHQHDDESYVEHTNAILELLMRKNEMEWMLQVFTDFQRSLCNKPLPARTLLSIGLIQEKQGRVREPVDIYNKIIRLHSQDPLVIKGYLSLARLYLSRLQNEEKAYSLLKEAYAHPLATGIWRSALEDEMKSHGWEIPATRRSGSGKVFPEGNKVKE